MRCESNAYFWDPALQHIKVNDAFHKNKCHRALGLYWFHSIKMYLSLFIQFLVDTFDEKENQITNTAQMQSCTGWPRKKWPDAIRYRKTTKIPSEMLQT